MSPFSAEYRTNLNCFKVGKNVFKNEIKHSYIKILINKSCKLERKFKI